MAGVELEDVDIRELYDCYTYSVGTLPNGRRWQDGATQLRALAYAVEVPTPSRLSVLRVVVLLDGRHQLLPTGVVKLAKDPAAWPARLQDSLVGGLWPDR